MSTITFKRTIQLEPDQPRTTLPPLPDTSAWPYPKPVPCAAEQVDESKCVITAKNPPPAQPTDALVNEGTLYEWRKARSGTQPEKYLGRIPQPVDPEGKEIFTSIFTALLPREHLREDDIDRCSHFHPPLGGVNICREHHEHQEGAVLLPVNETSAREDGPPALPACLVQRQPDEPPTTAPPPVPETAAIPNPAPVSCQAPQADNTKCIIRVKNPAPWHQQAAQSMPATNTTPPPDTYQAALVELGKLLLKDEGSKPLDVPQEDQRPMYQALGQPPTIELHDPVPQ